MKTGGAPTLCAPAANVGFVEGFVSEQIFIGESYHLKKYNKGRVSMQLNLIDKPAQIG